MYHRAKHEAKGPAKTIRA
uniref:Uncharacterized protein n=1 Tax=Arundo donax TaxID=35708 RepID=A0A0A8ZGG4_ARUDO